MNNQQLSKNLFSTLNETKSKNSFKCRIYFIKILKLETFKKIDKKYKSKIFYILKKSRVPLHYILDINYPKLSTLNSLNEIILYFSKYKKYIYTRKKLTHFIKTFKTLKME
jgi:hypothetical protein